MDLSSPACSGSLDGPPKQAAGAGEDRVLVLAPTGNDARLTIQVLGEAGIHAKACANEDELYRGLEDRCAAAIIAEETLGAVSAVALVAALAGQPKWSDIPVLIITSGGEAGQSRLRRLAVFGPGTNVTLLERPFRPGTLVSSVQAALRSRSRQYQVRDLLEEVSSARDAAEEANRAKDNFLAALSHELRTPLNPVLLIATEAASSDDLSPDVRADFELIAKNVMLEARLIDDLLDLTRITRGKMNLEARPAALHGIIRDAISNVTADLAEKHLTLSMDFCEGNPIVKCDPVRLQQVFWNVLKNAAKFTEKNGKINVRTLRNSDTTSERVTVAISDNGIGISASEISRIFDAFAQGDHGGNGNGHRFGGLGLGLAIARNIVELHSGTITASSDGVGLGAKFSIELQLAGS
jgi:signal transduction histidine kinase